MLVKTLLFVFLILITQLNTILSLSISKSSSNYNSDELTEDYWNRLGEASLKRAINQKLIFKKAKNVVLFIGDGMSISTITASRILKGQLANKPGEESILSFENLPHVSLIKTYNVDRQVSDSAGTATAFLCGVKANYETLGVNAKITINETQCANIEQNSVTSILQMAIEAGKSAGIVTNTRLTHATPAAGYSHSSYRYYESEIPASLMGGNCKDIARQLIENEPGSQLRVILGGGRRHFLPNNQTDFTGINYGWRNDYRNLINDWIDQKSNNGLKYAFVNSTGGLRNVDYDSVEYLFGAFSFSHMAYEPERDTSMNGEPSLEEMTRSAIRILGKNSNGFVLLVEGGRIDHAHHDNFGGMSLHETLSFEQAIQSAMDILPEEENLIIVSSDHSHTLTINGYPLRGNPILSVTHENDTYNQTFTTLMYGNGPGFIYPRPDPIGLNTSDNRYQQLSAVHIFESNHAGEDVAIYSRGPMSHLFQSTEEQSYVAHVISFASCIGNYQNEDHCSTTENPNSSTTENPNSSTTENPNSSTTENSNSSTTIYSIYIIVYLILNFICSIIF